MTPLFLAIVLFALGSVLLVAEFVIPAHGATAGMGLVAMFAAVVACFFVSEWLGVAVLAAGAIAGPLAGAGWVRLFPHSRLGRRLVLPPALPPESDRPSAPGPVRVGQIGVTLSALRPSGLCEFRDLRVQDDGDATPTAMLRVHAVSDFGPVAPGQRVRVVCYSDGRAVVRAIGETVGQSS